jgi:hypothetical protein
MTNQPTFQVEKAEGSEQRYEKNLIYDTEETNNCRIWLHHKVGKGLQHNPSERA